ncbi:hypothetical protein [Deinococcus radiophilus]
MVLLSFAFPILVRLGEALGLAAGTAAAALWTILVFVVAAAFVRWRVSLERVRADQLTLARQQVSERPSDAAAYHLGGQHLALMLLQRGRRREAAEVIDRYSQLAGARDAEIMALKEALSSADRWRFKREDPARPPVRELQAAHREEVAQRPAAQPQQVVQVGSAQGMGDQSVLLNTTQPQTDQEQQSGGNV